MKRTCQGCKAFQYETRKDFISKCYLGYKKTGNHPSVECPKPRTIYDYLTCIRKKEKGGVE